MSLMGKRRHYRPTALNEPFRSPLHKVGPVMRNAPPTPNLPRPAARRGRGILAGVLVLGCLWSGGCAALTNPVADGVPVHRLPPDVFGKRKDDERTIPLTLLRQKPPDVYRLAAGDVLGIYIEGVLGEPKSPPPIH